MQMSISLFIKGTSLCKSYPRFALQSVAKRVKSGLGIKMKENDNFGFIFIQ